MESTPISIEEQETPICETNKNEILSSCSEKSSKKRRTILERILLVFAVIGLSVYNRGKDVVCCLMGSTVKRKQEDQLIDAPKKRVEFSTGKMIQKLLKPVIGVFYIGRIVSNSLRKHKGKHLRKQMARMIKRSQRHGRGKRITVRSVLNYLLPVASVSVLLLTIQHVNEKTFAVAVFYNDVDFGYVQDESTIEKAQQIVQERMVYLSDAERIMITPSYQVKETKSQPVLDSFALADKLIESSNDDIVQAEGLYVDDQFYGAVQESGQLQQYLDTLLEKNKTGELDEEVSFLNDIAIEPGIYLVQNVMEPEKLFQEVEKSSTPVKTHKLIKGDSLLSISRQYEVSVNRLRLLNRQLKLPKEEQDELENIDQITIQEKQTALPVKVVSMSITQEEIPFEQEVEETEDFPQSYRKVTQAGEEGEQEITLKQTFVNGEKVDQETVAIKVKKKPITQKITVGTGEEKTHDWGQGSEGDGRVPDLIWPLDNPSISSFYAPRWGTFHGGIDVIKPGGGSYGLSVKAAASGVVIFADYSGGYGYLVKIDHGDGVQTWYGHNSKLTVKSGDVISQGEEIAKVGSTGHSTGPHIHLELRINGQRINPINYLPKIH